MKTTVVPAQITTVEDKVAGNLSMSQLLMFSFPVFLGALLYAGLPPFMGSASYKLVLIGSLAFTSGVLGIRFRGKLFIQWIAVIGKYNLRPRYFVYSKASTYNRLETELKAAEQTVADLVTDPNEPQYLTTPLNLSDRVNLETLMGNPAANLSFKTDKRGGIHVLIAEVE